MQCSSPYKVFNDAFPGGLEVPCGNCMACRITRASVWKIRLLHELDYWDSAVFVTLTYSPENVPDGYSLVKTDIQKFFKRLRKQLGTRRIKYYATGEYGEKYSRPHYHAIIFGLSPKNQDLIARCWPFGYVHTGTVTSDSCQYVAGYINKKLTGKLARENYQGTGREPPFNISSQGLGKRFALDNQDTIKDKLYLTNNQGKKVPIPRYYRNLLELDYAQYKNFFRDKEHKDVCYHITRGDYSPRHIVSFVGSADLKLRDIVNDAVANSRRIQELTLRKKLQTKKRDIF